MLSLLLDIAAPIPIGVTVAALWHLWDTRRNRCGCGHDLAFHDPDTGTCCTTRRRRKYGDARARYEHVPCTCRQYTGRHGPQERHLKSVA